MIDIILRLLLIQIMRNARILVPKRASIEKESSKNDCERFKNKRN
jgi:hypothetical protein